MKKYEVTIPIAGYMLIEVETENGMGDAEELAWDKASELLGQSKLPYEVQELDLYMKIVEGNVCYVYQPRCKVKEIEDYE